MAQWGAMRPRPLRWLLVAGVMLSMAPSTSAVHAQPVPVRRVMIVVLENTDYEAALAQPFLGQLAARGALLSSFFAETHPSQPNYVAMTAGSTYGLTSNADVTLDVPHVGDLLEAAGRSWRVYAEGYPGNCFLGSSMGAYVRRHVPFLSFRSVQTNATRCQRIVNASALANDVANGTLPDYGFYVPDLNNSGHDTGVAFADQWLARTFGPLLEDARFMDGTLFVVTFDEDDGIHANHIYTVLSGTGVRPGSVSTSRYDHYSLLRTIEDVLGLGGLGQRDADAQPVAGVWRAARDFNGDGRSDVLWRDTSGNLALWLMSSGGALAGNLGVGMVPTTWAIIGIGDFDGDGRADILWRDTAGDVVLWRMSSNTVVGVAGLESVSTAWTAKIGDFDGDGKADILWRNTASGAVVIWLMNGGTVAANLALGVVPTAWTVVGIGDFDGDGKADILWQDAAGNLALWLMSGGTVLGSPSLGNVPLAWMAQIGDFDGNGKADIVWRHASSGAVAIWLMSGATVMAAVGVGTVSTTWTIEHVGDFDGDRKTDILWRSSSGSVVSWLMNGLTVVAAPFITNVSVSWTAQ